MQELDHQHFMKMAIEQAKTAYEDGEVPVGAVIVSPTGRIIGKGYNQVEKLQDPTAHAEMIAITAAADTLGAKYLKDCTLYVTLEPCIMCGGAISWAQLENIVFGARDPKKGFLSVTPDIINKKKMILGEVLAEECQEILTNFFNDLRT